MTLFIGQELAVFVHIGEIKLLLFIARTSCLPYTEKDPSLAYSGLSDNDYIYLQAAAYAHMGGSRKVFLHWYCNYSPEVSCGICLYGGKLQLLQSSERYADLRCLAYRSLTGHVLVIIRLFGAISRVPCVRHLIMRPDSSAGLT